MRGSESFCVAQLGARRNYAVLRILHAAGMLERAHTDLVAVKGWPAVVRRLTPKRWRNAAMVRMLARVPDGVPPSKITHWPGFAIEYARRLRAATSRTGLTSIHLWAGHEFCRRIIGYGLGEVSTVYAFNSAGLELLQHAREKGLFCVMEQTSAPAGIEDELLAEEHSAFPEWEPPWGVDSRRAELAARERGEWEFADLILCGSEFVRSGIAKLGGPAERCAVVPYGVDSNGIARGPKEPSRRLRVLVAGAVRLGKGAGYVLGAAQAAKSLAEFRWCGGGTAARRDLATEPIC